MVDQRNAGGWRRRPLIRARVATHIALVFTFTAATACTKAAPPPTEPANPPTSTVLTSAPSTTSAPTTTPTTVPVPVPTYVDAQGFNDHTVPRVTRVDELLALARTDDTGQAVIKFVFTNPDQQVGPVNLFDSNFYSLHDEWYWFRLLNGQPIEGVTVEPLRERTFATIADVYTWARAQPEGALPLGLKFSEQRLYSPEFYNAALFDDVRKIGVGSIIRFTPSPGGRTRWLLELEYIDKATPEWIATLFARLTPALPKDVADSLEWVVRSPQQQSLAEEMKAAQLPFHDRIVSYADIVPKGTVGVYSEGITAGQLIYVSGEAAPGEANNNTSLSKDFGDVRPGDIVITEHVPDWLPPANAIITSDPQTPLAHVNLLARNRGIPNASQAGIHTNAAIRQAADVRAYAMVIARGKEMQIALIEREEYEAWLATESTSRSTVPSVNVSAQPLVVDLQTLAKDLAIDELSADEVDRWQPILGGKSAGFLTLLTTPGVTTPPTPMAITVRPYVEHIRSLRNTIAAVIAEPEFVDNPRARRLLLEGSDGYESVFPSEDDKRFADEFAAANEPGTPLGDVLAIGGIRGLIEDRKIDEQTLASITEKLARAYRDYDVETGLRFRSSSNVEDIEGFNGAGLYTSYTGFLNPELLKDPKDHDKTIERAILRAWSSYWSFEAFEERALERIDHLSGAMGLTVHARFDDSLEQNNGVATFTYVPGANADRDVTSDDAVLQINVQVDANPVTNPDPESKDLPEVVRVERRNGTTTITRVASSTLVTSGEPILRDAAVQELFEQTSAIASSWRARANKRLDPARRMQTVVLDYEFKTMKAGWPKLATPGNPFPERLIVRQVRSLDPGMRRLSRAVRNLPVPNDILMRAALIERVACANGTHHEVLTDPLRAPDMGHADRPFVAEKATADGTDTSTCARTILYASRDRYLLELLDKPGTFVINRA